MENINKEAELAKLLGLQETTVKSVKLSPSHLNDLYNRASASDQAVKTANKVGFTIMGITGILAAASFIGIGTSQTHSLATAVAIVDTVMGALIGLGISATVMAVGASRDQRDSIRQTVNDMALNRLAEIDRQSSQPPAPVAP